MTHPLDPLSREEISAAVTACKTYHSQNSPDSPPLRFNVVTLKEPAKVDLLAFKAGGEVPVRQAFCILQAPPLQTVIETVIDLSSGPKSSVAGWKTVEGVNCLFSPDDCLLSEAICKADEEVQKLLRERGITDMDLVIGDPWSIHLPPKELNGSLIQCFMYLRSSAADNQYSKPLDFTPIVDLITGKVVRIDKPHGDSPPELPTVDVNYHRDLMDPKGWRQGLKPLTVAQPEGASFVAEGNSIKWQKWHIRHSFNYREGLVLHDVGYEDGGKVRPVMHRGSLVEMCVPYADPNPPFQRKCAFDVGDYGLGYCANSLELGCDCVGKIHYFDADMVDSKGEPWTVKKAVCLHEEDAGILWKHTEYRTGHAEVRRGRCLVLSFIATVVNYEYAFYWSFYQDGSIKYEIKLTGELSTNLLSPGEGPKPKWGTLVADRVNAQYHQHMFCARLDMAVDDEEGGKGLQVSEVEVEIMDDGPDNPYGNGWTVKDTPLSTEATSQRVCNAETARYWKISNPASKHAITGSPVAWKLMPGGGPTLIAKPNSGLAKRGAFSAKNLWVTPHSDTECWPAGDYTIQSEGGEGLSRWTQQDRAVGPGSDPVLWHCFGVTHIPRPEDFPVMPVEHAGFMLKPFGFFNGNPATDLPFAPDAGSSLAEGSCCGAANGAANGHANGASNGHANGGSTGHAH